MRGATAIEGGEEGPEFGRGCVAGEELGAEWPAHEDLAAGGRVSSAAAGPWSGAQVGRPDGGVRDNARVRPSMPRRPVETSSASRWSASATRVPARASGGPRAGEVRTSGPGEEPRVSRAVERLACRSTAKRVNSLRESAANAAGSLPVWSVVSSVMWLDHCQEGRGGAHSTAAAERLGCRSGAAGAFWAASARGGRDGCGGRRAEGVCRALAGLVARWTRPCGVGGSARIRCTGPRAVRRL
jgi:hypothetical protein